MTQASFLRVNEGWNLEVETFGAAVESAAMSEERS